MKRVKIAFLLLTILSTLLANAKVKSSVSTFIQTKKEEKVLIDKILKIDEAKQLAKGLGKSKKTVFALITDRVTLPNSDCEISVGYKDASGYDTQYIFRIKKKYITKSEIEPYLEILDLGQGAYVPLFVYRKKQHAGS